MPFHSKAFRWPGMGQSESSGAVRKYLGIWLTCSVEGFPFLFAATETGLFIVVFEMCPVRGRRQYKNGTYVMKLEKCWIFFSNQCLSVLSATIEMPVIALEYGGFLQKYLKTDYVLKYAVHCIRLKYIS